MKKKFEFSVIIPIYNVEEYLEETIESVINQTIGFENNIQLVLINDGSPDNSEEICLKYKKLFPNNVIYYKQKNAGVSAARNKGLELAEGEFVNFLDSDDKWEKDVFAKAKKMFKNNSDIDVVSFKLKFFDAKSGTNHPLNKKFSKDRIIDIKETPQFLQLSAASSIIRKKAINNKFNSKLKYGEDAVFINKIILEKMKYGVIGSSCYLYRKREDGTSAIDNSIKKHVYYNDTLINFHEELLNYSQKNLKEVPKYIQNVILYDLKWRINNKIPEGVLTEEETQEYIDRFKKIVKSIDDDVIMANNFYNFIYKIYYLSLKPENKDIFKKIKYEDGKLRYKELSSSKYSSMLIEIDQTYVRKDKIIFWGKYNQKLSSKENLDLIVDGKKQKINFYELTINYNRPTVCNDELYDFIGINFEIDLNKASKIELKIENKNIIPKYKPWTIITHSLPKSYHNISKKTIINNRMYIEIKNKNIFRNIKNELLNDIALIRNKRYKAVNLRILTKFLRAFSKKEVWFISDRVNKADDNGEHFFDYMIKNHPDKKVYFVLAKTSPDYERMKKIGNVIDPNSLKYKMIFYRADYVVSSHAENYIYNPLGMGGRFIQDQNYLKFIFLQHGITKDDLSPWLNVNTKKIDMFVAATENEYKSLLEYKYYFGKDVVKLTGMPRYDTLLKKQKIYKPKKQIMLSLTWRNSLSSPVDKKTGERFYNPDFKKSDYFKFINNLLNDKKLLEALEKYNYKIKFIPHPNVLSQLKDFDRNKYIEIEEKSINYQKEFCENKILITDYSSVFFDFGYLMKPSIYFHDKNEDFFQGQVYQKGYWNYDTMSFGPLFNDYDNFIEELINIIKKDGALENKYKKVIEKTFKFRDDKNCERVYEEIIKL